MFNNGQSQFGRVRIDRCLRFPDPSMSHHIGRTKLDLPFLLLILLQKKLIRDSKWHFFFFFIKNHSPRGGRGILQHNWNDKKICFSKSITKTTQNTTITHIHLRDENTNRHAWPAPGSYIYAFIDQVINQIPLRLQALSQCSSISLHKTCLIYYTLAFLIPN